MDFKKRKRRYTYITLLAVKLLFLLLLNPACAICGVLCISLPIPIIVNNFNKFYEKAKIEEEIEAKRKKTSWEDAKRGNYKRITITYFFLTTINFRHNKKCITKK